MRNTSVPAHNCRHFAMQRQHYGGIVIALTETERQFFGTRDSGLGTRDARFNIAVVVHTELRNHERRIAMTARDAERSEYAVHALRAARMSSINEAARPLPPRAWQPESPGRRRFRL